MLTCKDFLNELTDYLDETVGPEIKHKLEQHVNECPNCWVVLDTTKKTIQVFKGHTEQEIPTDIHDRLLIAVRKRMCDQH